MNYRHIYHAGNFADVFKHAVLARILAYLRQKDAPFRVLDTHGGIGLYDLSSEAAEKTGEWRDGIGRLDGELPPALAGFLAPYLEAVAAIRAGAPGAVYPGSPLIIRHHLRPGDGLTATELHPDDVATLKRCFEFDRQAKVIELDGWLALKSFLPFRERRGLVLIDPPFEATDEFAAMARGLVEAQARAATLTYMLWYPVKDHAGVGRFVNTIAGLGIRKILRAELAIAAPGQLPGLSASGLIVINPPWTLHDELQAALPLLAARLARAPGAATRVEWLVGE